MTNQPEVSEMEDMPMFNVMLIAVCAIALYQLVASSVCLYLSWPTERNEVGIIIAAPWIVLLLLMIFIVLVIFCCFGEYPFGLEEDDEMMFAPEQGEIHDGTF